MNSAPFLRTPFRPSEASDDEVRELWERYAFEGLIPLLHSRVEASDLATAANDFVQSLKVYRVDQDQLVNDLAEKPVLSLEYQHNSPRGQKATSSVRLIFDKGLPNKWAFTANGAFTLYDARPPDSVPDASRWRDTQFGIEVRRSLGNLQGFGAASVSSSYYYQYQNSPSILPVAPGQPLPNITFTGFAGNRNRSICREREPAYRTGSVGAWKRYIKRAISALDQLFQPDRTDRRSDLENADRRVIRSGLALRPVAIPHSPSAPTVIVSPTARRRRRNGPRRWHPHHHDQLRRLFQRWLA